MCNRQYFKKENFIPNLDNLKTELRHQCESNCKGLFKDRKPFYPYSDNCPRQRVHCVLSRQHHNRPEKTQILTLPSLNTYYISTKFAILCGNPDKSTNQGLRSSQWVHLSRFRRQPYKLGVMTYCGHLLFIPAQDPVPLLW